MNRAVQRHPIVSDPAVMLGEPTFAGTRMPVYTVLDLIDAGLDPAEIVDDYPALSLDDIEAALAFRRAANDAVIERTL